MEKCRGRGVCCGLGYSLVACQSRVERFDTPSWEIRPSEFIVGLTHYVLTPDKEFMTEGQKE